MTVSELAHKISSAIEKESGAKAFEHETYLNGTGCQFTFYIKDKAYSIDIWDEDVLKEFNK